MKLIEPATMDYLKKQKEIVKSLHNIIHEIGNIPDGYFKIEMSKDTGRVNLRFGADEESSTFGCQTIYTHYLRTDFKRLFDRTLETNIMLNAFDTMAEKINPKWRK